MFVTHAAGSMVIDLMVVIVPNHDPAYKLGKQGEQPYWDWWLVPCHYVEVILSHFEIGCLTMIYGHLIETHCSLKAGWGGWGCEVSCGGHHRQRKDHHGVSSGWSSIWFVSNTGLSSTQYEQITIIFGVWPFWLTPFSFQSITFCGAYG